MGSGGTNAGYQVELNKIADAVATPADSQVAVAPGHPQHFAVDSRPEPGSVAPPGFTPPPGSASSATGLVQPADWADPQTDLNPLWRPRPHPRYHRLDDDLRPVDVAIGLGSHDPGVATYTADLYHQGVFPLVAFTGANAPTTVERFPRGEAVRYRDIAIGHAVPSAAILTETQATNTGENITFTRKLLAAQGITPKSVLVSSKPYQQRRAHATVRKLWPEVDVISSAAGRTSKPTSPASATQTA
jgi:hypothetical protein